FALRALLVVCLLLGAASSALAVNAATHGPKPPPFKQPPPSTQPPPPPSTQPGGQRQQGPSGPRTPARPHTSSGTGPKALINADTIVGDPSLEEQEAAADGFSVDVVSGSTWDSMSASDFAGYQVLIIGDPTCSSIASSATSNASTWAPVVMGTAGGNALPGNRVLIGTDPVYHYNNGRPGALTLIKDGIAFAGALSGRTGVYFDASCDRTTNNPTVLSILDALSTGSGSWSENGSPPCGGNVSLIASNSLFSDLTSADIEGWSCSVHETFPSFK